MKYFTSCTLLLAVFATAGCATGKLDFTRCVQGVFGEMRCAFTEAAEEGDNPESPPDGQQAIASTFSSHKECAEPEASVAGTRAHRRCKRMAYQLAQSSPVLRY